MIRDYRFKDIEKYLSKDSDIGRDVLDAFNSLSDAAILFSPIAFSHQILPVLELLEVKDRLFSLGYKIYDFITSKVEADHIVRMEQIKAAYALICYTAYFDVLQEALPSNVRRKLKLKFEKKKALIEESIDSSDCLQPPYSVQDIHCNIFYADHITSFSEIKEQLVVVYERITQGLVKMIAESSIFDEEKQNQKKEFDSLMTALSEIPQKAIEVYEAQYIKLADQFSDFAFFAQMQNFKGIHNSLKRNQAVLNMLASKTQEIDVGLTSLNNFVNSIETNFSIIQAQDIVDDLKRKYNATIDEPIIDDKEIMPDTERLSLRFPRIVDAFIPQSYKCLLYQRKETLLEDESIWRSLPVQNDLKNFFIEYLYSLDNIDYPLVILGHPGSGKSLLTKVLSAQLMSNSYTVIRIPLREVSAEDGIDVLVEDQIKKLTNRPLSTQGYGGFAMQFNEKPLIIILDGYDELLQAKGNVFSGYLEKARAFQQDQKTMNRPVRLIITSRITLIDKARIPENTTILRLMEFDTHQRQTWIDKWNRINSDYFSQTGINPFKLPPKERGIKNSIIELAEQPLLLLMLALYDSDKNELAQTSNINRTELYDNLLRRFVRRERRRYVPGFADLSSKVQEEIVENEMNRLGVVAIGMYNRQEVVILSKQLEKDLDTFKARRTDGSPEAETLKESESVLGGFFFIHKSTACDVDAHSDNSDSAFEFLHNTFGEFLAADFILRNTINEVREIFIDRKFKSAGLENKLSNPDAFNFGWFFCLMFVPLYSRPVVIEMLREHILKALQRFDCSLEISHSDFIDNLMFIVQNQLKMILNTRNSPSVMRNGILLDRDIPLLGYLSIYSLNLIILACTLCPEGFEFNEDDYRNSEVNELDSKPWDKLASLWKTWFSPADLAGLSVILKAKRKSESIVHVRCNDRFEATRYEQPIDILLCISSTLADNLLTGLSGLQTHRFHEITRFDTHDIKKMLENESPDLYFSYLIASLRREINGFSDERSKVNGFRLNYYNVNETINTIIDDQRIQSINRDTLLSLFEILECCFQRNMIFYYTRRMLVSALPRLIDNLKLTTKKKFEPEYFSGIRLWQLLTTNNDLFGLDKRMIYDDPFFRNDFVGAEWNEEIDQHIRFQSRHTKNGRVIKQEFEGNFAYQRSLLNSIENSLIRGSEEKAKALEQFVDPERLQVLLETNLELLSRAILILIKDVDMRQKVNPETLDNYLKGCLHQLSSEGIGCFGFNAIINAIKIARHVGEERFLREFSKILEYQLFGGHLDFFSALFCVNPAFVANLIEVLPELFTNISIKMFDLYYFKKHTRGYFESEKILDYIRVYRYLSEFSKITSDDLRHNMLRTFRIDSLKNIDLLQLTIVQLDDLFWYANYIDDKLFSSEIKGMLSHFQSLKSKRLISLFDVIIDKYEM